MICVLYIFFQIVGESFPISSSGHLIFLENVYYFLFPHQMRYTFPFWFDYIIHIPTVLIVLCYFWHKFFIYLRSLFAFSFEIIPMIRSVCITDALTVCCYVGKKYVSSFPLCIGFFITSIALYSLRYISESAPKNSLEELSLQEIVTIAIAQCISLLPGVSRFGMTFVAARWQGLSNNESFFYSFLIALPLFSAAGLQGIIKVSTESDSCIHLYSWQKLGASIVLATAVSYYAFVMVGSLIRANRLWYISYYMFAMSMIVAVYSLLV